MFIDRDPALFRWVLSYLRAGALPQLPRYSSDPGLWQALLQEAEFLGLEPLCAFLKCTKRCEFEHSRDSNGLLYWLGTNRGNEAYTNPCTSGAVRITSSVDRITCTATGNFECQHHNYRSLLYPEPNDLHDLVAHRPRYTITWRGSPSSGEADIHAAFKSRLKMGVFEEVDIGTDFWVQIDLASVSLAPTHYSLAQGDSSNVFGLTRLNLLGSVDGNTWDTLHSWTNDLPKGFNREAANAIREYLQDQGKEAPATLKDAQAERMARTLCKSWALDGPSDKFYRSFRLHVPQHAGGDPNCFFVNGFELYGDVCEHPDR